VIPFAVLAAAILLFRGLGEAGIAALDSWASATRWGLAVMFAFTAVSHFAPMRADLLRMIPAWVPWPRLALYFTGVCEAAGGLGLLAARTRALSAIGLIALLVAVFPANVHAARSGVTIRGRRATPLWIRGPMQVVLIGLVWWAGLIG
jgi:uncharacterized membrane protein